MRRSLFVIIVICLLVAGLFLGSYLAGSFAGTEPVPTNVTQQPKYSPTPVIAQTLDKGPFSLEKTNLLAADLQMDLPNETMEKEIRYIQAENVDDAGRAMAWIYGVVGPDGETRLVYDAGGWDIAPWTGGLPYTPIDINNTMPLGVLMQENQKLLATSAGEKRRVALWNETYRITISGTSGIRTYAFDAITGTLVESHEQ